MVVEFYRTPKKNGDGAEEKSLTQFARSSKLISKTDNRKVPSSLALQGHLLPKKLSTDTASPEAHPVQPQTSNYLQIPSKSSLKKPRGREDLSYQKGALSSKTANFDPKFSSIQDIRMQLKQEGMLGGEEIDPEYYMRVEELLRGAKARQGTD